MLKTKKFLSNWTPY